MKQLLKGRLLRPVSGVCAPYWTVRGWFAADVRFRRVLAGRDLGGVITCVAVRA